ARSQLEFGIFEFGWRTASDGIVSVQHPVHELHLAPMLGLSALWARECVSAVRPHQPRLHVVLERQGEDLADDAFAQVAVLDGKHHLDATEKVARHPIGAADKNPGLASVLEVKNPAVLEKPVHHATHGDVVADSFEPGPQATNAAHDEIDIHARL